MYIHVNKYSGYGDIKENTREAVASFFYFVSNYSRKLDIKYIIQGGNYGKNTKS